jgi:SAM-dependent methyltransferase
MAFGARHCISAGAAYPWWFMLISTMLGKLQKFIRYLISSDPKDKIRLHRRLKETAVIGPIYSRLLAWKARLSQRDSAGYLHLQKRLFEQFAAADEVREGEIRGDYVVGSWRQHDEWPDYETYLMKYVPHDASWLALEYGCGPGRNIRRWSAIFRRIDGVDISSRNLENARAFLKDQLPPEKTPKLFLTGGDTCGDAPESHYDFAFSTICLQHICVHEVRLSILESLFRCLKPGGRLSAQMGFGSPSPNTVPYDANYYMATGTNRDCDVCVASPEQIGRDLASIGFRDFEYWIRPVGPGDVHPNWIFFTARKP